MIQQFHLWIYTQKKWKEGLKQIYTCVRSSIIHKSQKVEATQMSINRWMDKQNMLYIYIYMMKYYSASKRSEIFIHATTWMKFEDIMLREIN